MSIVSKVSIASRVGHLEVEELEGHLDADEAEDERDGVSQVVQLLHRLGEQGVERAQREQREAVGGVHHEGVLLTARGGPSWREAMVREAVVVGGRRVRGVA